jgi:hypothetical protein
VLLLAACGGGDATEPSSSAPTTSASAASSSSAPTSSSAPPSPSGTSPTSGPSGPGSIIAAFQLCGTALGLSAGWIGQVSAEQLAEGRNAYAEARDEYADDGSGLLQKADAVVAAVDAQNTPEVIRLAQELGTACQSVNPGT